MPVCLRVVTLSVCLYAACALRSSQRPRFANIQNAAVWSEPGTDLEVSPANAVAQLNDQGLPVKMIPVNVDGWWEFPTVSSDVKRDLNLPREHYWPDGLHDVERGGTNLYPGTLVSLDGHDYQKMSPPRRHVASVEEAKTPAGVSKVSGVSTAPERPVQPIDLNTLTADVVLPKFHPEAVAFQVPQPTFDVSAPNIPNLQSPNIPGLPSISAPKLNVPSVQLPQAPLPKWSAPSFSIPSAPGWDLSGLSSLLGMQLSGFNLNFPQLKIWNPKFPSFSLSPSLPNLPGFPNLFSAFGGVAIDAPDEQTPIKDKLCFRDYKTSPCPSGWTFTGGLCAAPGGYTGACSRLMDFSKYTVRGLSLWASQCKAPWPCVSSVTSLADCPDGRDYTVACPKGWILKSQGCAPGSKYKGVCRNPTYSTLQFTQQEKEHFEAACQVTWPCRTQPCVEDYNVPCPLGYRIDADGTRCVAEDVRRVSCPSTPSGLYDWSVEAKKAWSVKCAAQWPCKKYYVNGKWVGCSQNYTIVCPENWKNVAESGLCEAPANYNIEALPKECQKNVQAYGRIAFDHWTTDQKETFSKLCFAPWPCSEDPMFPTARANTPVQGCPIGFHLQTPFLAPTTDVVCESDAIIKRSPCDDTRNFGTLTKQELQALSQICNFQWNATRVARASDFLYGSDSQYS